MSTHLSSQNLKVANEKSKRKAILLDIARNKLRMSEFALNNICTAKCQFCSIWQQRNKVSVDTDKALKTISHLASLGVRFITLTGGEPLLHPGFERLIERCNQENVVSAILAADARLFTQKRLEALGRNNPDLVCISVDHHEEDVAYESRKIPDILAHTERAVRELRNRGIKTMASTLICDYNHTSLRELFQKCTDMGFDFITVNYPEFSDSPVYTLGGDAITLTREDILKNILEIVDLKKEFTIANTTASIRNIASYLKGETPEYLCLGGYRVFFIDWFFQAHPCMHLGRSLGDVLDLRQENLIKNPCNDCNMSWYRDFSIYFYGIKSIKPLYEGLDFVFNSVF
jgi:MoaA/NifB/PqqE/SkfB family radical SAM enzyme